MNEKILNKKGLPLLIAPPKQIINGKHTPITNRNKCITDHVYMVTMLII